MTARTAGVMLKFCLTEQDARDFAKAQRFPTVVAAADSETGAWGYGVWRAEPAKLSGTKHNGALAAPAVWSPQIQRAADVKIETLDPLWPGVIYRNYINLLAGEPGVGKSVLQCALAAIVSTGGQWPCSNQRAEKGTVLFLTAEDRPEDVIVPRLIAAGADLTRVHFLRGMISSTGEEREIDLVGSLPILADAMKRTGATLVCVDPITAYESRDVDSHKNSDVRGMLKPVQSLMSEHKAALWAVTHFNKNTGTSGLNRIMGSIAYVAASRSSYAVIRDRDNEERRLLLNAKVNLGPGNRGFSYTLEDVNGVPRLLWGADPVAGRLDELLNEPRVSAKERACEFLNALLADGQPMRAAELFAATKTQGIGENTARSALNALRARRTREGANGPWFYQLVKPTEVPEEEWLGDGK